MLVKLLEIRTMILTGYQKIRYIVNPAVKFFLGFIVFSSINEAIGYDARFASGLITVLLSVICAVLPLGVLVFCAMVLTLLHLLNVSVFLAAVMFAAYLIMYFMLMRFSPKYAIAAVLIPVLAKYNLHYAVPIVLGCITNPLAILPTVCGVFVYYVLQIIEVAATRNVSTKMDDILQLYIDIIDAVKADRQMFIMMVVFALVIIVIYVIRKLPFDYSFIVSIGAGVVTNILGFLIAGLKYGINVQTGTLLGMSVVSGLIAYVVEFMKHVLDYTGVERVQFEDDDYYYYVKAVPKVSIGIPRRDYRNISRDEDEYPDDDDYPEEDDGYDDGNEDYPGEYEEDNASESSETEEAEPEDGYPEEDAEESDDHADDGYPEGSGDGYDDGYGMDEADADSDDDRGRIYEGYGENGSRGGYREEDDDRLALEQGLRMSRMAAQADDEDKDS